MSTNYKRYLVFLFLAGMVWVWAGPGRSVQNEDLRFIMAWEKEQKAAELAQTLQLTAEQLAAIRETRAQIDALKADSEPQIQETETALAETAVAVRQHLEEGGQLNDEDRHALRQHLVDLRGLRREFRKRVDEATKGLWDGLSEEQQILLRETLRPELMETMVGQGEGDGERPRGRHGQARRFQGRGEGGGTGEGPRFRRGPRRGDHPATHILISDAFLNQVQ